MFDVGLEKVVRITFLAVRRNSDTIAESVRFLKKLKIKWSLVWIPLDFLILSVNTHNCFFVQYKAKYFISDELTIFILLFIHSN